MYSNVLHIWSWHKLKKTKSGFFEKSGFPGSEPDFRISVHGAAMGGPRSTYNQNFMALAAVVSKSLLAFENDNYILDDVFDDLHTVL